MREAVLILMLFCSFRCFGQDVKLGMTKNEFTSQFSTSWSKVKDLYIEKDGIIKDVVQFRGGNDSATLTGEFSFDVLTSGEYMFDTNLTRVQDCREWLNNVGMLVGPNKWVRKSDQAHLFFLMMRNPYTFKIDNYSVFVFSADPH